MFSTPLLDIESKLNADIGEFAGWQMPMKYSSYQEEHMAVRTSAAFFDLSHMGRLRVKGNIDQFNYLIAKDIRNTPVNNMVGPTAFLNDKGGFVDDVMSYKVSDNEFLIVTNAINREKVIHWIESNSSLEVEDLTFKYAMIAIQGRNVWNFIEKIELKPLEFRLNTKFLGEEVFLLSRSGWTGEDGVEVWGVPETISKIIQRLVSVGVRPAGLICRDSIRQEMGFVLYGEDIDENTTPVEARYWVFSLDKQYVGREKIIEQLKNGVEKIRVGLKLKKGERSIPRKDNKIKLLDSEIGYVTSSIFSPYLNRVIGMGYINSKHAIFGYSVNIEIRNKQVEAKLQDFPFI
ncbi:glycine cleavage system aminomethyltransferase GcvT [Sulfurisphaera javensis]|uniref:aminomethyltransferase n=1 Tax=Sulfurisphaera javensis TaxID=2049879 RepID=A0AAT9GTV3_9CREN